MKRWTMAAVAGALIALSTAPPPAQADPLAKTGAMLVNAAFGWLDCFKAIGDEGSKAASRWYVGTLVTAPLMCGTNVAVRYVGVGVDAVTIPWNGTIIEPDIFAGSSPPITLTE
jgi:hypothetical protein